MDRSANGGPSDLELVERCQADDTAAFQVLVERYQQRATRLAYRYVRNQEDARDITQEAFIRAFRSIKDFRNESQFYTWLYRILVNLSLDHLRRNKMETSEYQDDLMLRSQTVAEAQHKRTNPREELWKKQRQVAIVGAIESLPDDQKTTVILREIDGLSYEEIAQVTRVPIGTVMSRLFYARRKLQDKLKEYVD
ncbi:MAG: sigma-70 family RNA polymerase sigma factor [Deltaproteobacteria bacterium]|nr:sigma-70 family RNA polymerase sigma factor [Deltaproteobacteria bacterium]